MKRNRKLNIDDVFEIWDETPDDTCETDESIPSGHDVLSDMELSVGESESDIAKTPNVLQADCVVAPEPLSNKGSNSNNRGHRSKNEVLIQRKWLLLIK